MTLLTLFAQAPAVPAGPVGFGVQAVTIIENQRRSAIFTGDGTTVTFPFNFPADLDTEIEVWEETISSGAVALLSTGFTVDRALQNITFSIAPTNLVRILILGRADHDQGTNILTGEGMFSNNVQKSVDDLAKLSQENNEMGGRSFVAAKFEALAEYVSDFAGAKNVGIEIEGLDALAINDTVTWKVVGINPLRFQMVVV